MTLSSIPLWFAHLSPEIHACMHTVPVVSYAAGYPIRGHQQHESRVQTWLDDAPPPPPCTVRVDLTERFTAWTVFHWATRGNTGENSMLREELRTGVFDDSVRVRVAMYATASVFGERARQLYLDHIRHLPSLPSPLCARMLLDEAELCSAYGRDAVQLTFPQRYALVSGAVATTLNRRDMGVS